MAIIYTYPEIKKLTANDRFIVSQMDSQNNPTKTVTVAQLASFINSAPQGGVGTTNTIVKFTDGPSGLIGDSVIRQDEPAAGGKVYIAPVDLSANANFEFGTGGSFSATAQGSASPLYELRAQNGGFYKKTFKFESKDGISIGRSSITANVTLDVGDASDIKPAAWFRNGVVVSNNPSGVAVDNTSMVVGAGNNDIVSGSDNCLAVGNNNQILADSDHSLAVGQGNTMTNADNSIVVGQQNTLTGTRLYSLGFSNSLTCASAFALGGENAVGGTQNNFAIGYNNNLQGSQKNFIFGTSNSCGTGASSYQQSIIIGNNCTLGIPSSGSATEFGMVVIGASNAQNYPGTTSGQPFRPKIVLAADVGSGQKDALVISEGVNGIASMLHSDALLEHNFADDTAAAAGGVPVGALYHNAGEVRIRIV